jgi:hypothetical protein
MSHWLATALQLFAAFHIMRSRYMIGEMSNLRPLGFPVYKADGVDVHKDS